MTAIVVPSLFAPLFGVALLCVRRPGRAAGAMVLALTVLAGGAGGLAVSALAGTPSHTFVMAMQIDDLISLDPAEVFEFSGAEYSGNVYDRLVYFDLDDPSIILPGIAESWSVSEDGLTYRFVIREGVTFHSGNPLTAHDAAYSLQRVIRLNLSPAFILTQFGFAPETVEATIRASDAQTLLLTTDRAYAPSFFLNCLTAGVASVVDSALLAEHEEGGDLGHGWLRTHSAGSGAFVLRAWKPNEALMLDANPDYWQGAPAIERAVIRHIAEPATQRLLLEKGDIDVARNLGADQLAGLAGNPDIRVWPSPKGALFYLGLNQKNPALSQPGVRRALRWLIDYDALQATILAETAVIQQAILPRGFLGALMDTPFSLDVEKAKALLAGAGYPEGFTVTMDTRNTAPLIDLAQSIQASFAAAGITLELIPGDGRQTLTKYRARNHDIYFGLWGADYQDPHTNAGVFAHNPDNGDDAQNKTLAWRNAWETPALSGLVEDAMLEGDVARRVALYQEIQQAMREDSPFVVMFQKVDVVAQRTSLAGFVAGPTFDTVFYRHIVK